jgi:hypothetical protein
MVTGNARRQRRLVRRGVLVEEFRSGAGRTLATIVSQVGRDVFAWLARTPANAG